MQQINQHVNNKVNEIMRDVDQKLDVDNKQDEQHEALRGEMDSIKNEMQEVLQNKINENHALIEESAKRMDALIKEANQLWTFF